MQHTERETGEQTRATGQNISTLIHRGARKGRQKHEGYAEAWEAGSTR